MSPKFAANYQSRSAGSARKPYGTPAVVEYGSLADITLTIAGSAKADGGTPVGNSNKTR